MPASRFKAVIILVAMAATLLPGPGLSSQAVYHLQSHGRSEMGFGFMGSIRVMPDGKVLVADPLGEVLTLVDLDAQRADTIGRTGGGPGEYRQPDGVFPLPGDSTLLVDLGNGRLSILSPGGRFARSIPIAQQNSAGQVTLTIPRFVDTHGHIYFQPDAISAGPIPDSAGIVRFDLSSGQADTVAWFKLEEPLRASGPSRVSVGRAPLGLRDDWAVAPDGSVAVISAEPYRIRWLRSDLPDVVGATTSYLRHPVREAEKEAWIDSFFSSSITVGIRRSADGSRQVNLSRGTPGGGGLDTRHLPWPDHLPPFRATRSIVSPQGELWVQRFGSAGAPVTMDVFDGSGQKMGEVELPPNRRVLGFGPGVIYLGHTDGLGLHWLERYRLLGD